jgi:poly-gamma-glutamate synthesis protein (capsule biosynthesis protein)
MSFNLFSCGDIVNMSGKKEFLDANLKKIIQDSDLAICNFEAPIRHENMQAIKKAGPHVYQSSNSISYIKHSGFNYVSLANNHIYDYGDDALKATIDELHKYNINYIGAGVDFDEAYQTKVFEKNGIKVGLLAACESEFGCLYEKQKRGGYAWLFHSLIEDNVEKLKQRCDFVVCVAHAGVEEIDVPIKEWRDRYRRLCDIGVDVILGHHPHVPQGYEEYGRSLIFYSLGNFYFDTVGYENKSDDSYSVLLEFEKFSTPKYQIIYHKKIDGITSLVDKKQVSFDLDSLNNLLGSGYEKLNNELSIELFKEYYYDYYKIALGKLPKKSKLSTKIKWFIKVLFFPTRGLENRNLLLLHNIRIDSHRFVVQRALSYLHEE